MDSVIADPIMVMGILTPSQHYTGLTMHKNPTLIVPITRQCVILTINILSVKNFPCLSND